MVLFLWVVNTQVGNAYFMYVVMKTAEEKAIAPSESVTVVCVLQQNHALPKDGKAPFGCLSKLNQQQTAGFSPYFHFARVAFAYLFFLTHAHLNRSFALTLDLLEFFVTKARQFELLQLVIC